ncbi:MAG: acyltransferase family protein [Woeseia sp.]|nr:acyltransferase family protein [Woeseia sp.]
MRYYAVDGLRAAMMSVVMFGHALLPYLTVPRRFKDPATHPGFDIVAIFLYSFAMPVFFVTAGFTAALMLRRKGLSSLARSRFRTIFLPLVVAYLLLSPLTRGAYVFATEVSASGSLQAGSDLLLRGHWIRWSKAYHLWFLVSLLLYTALAVGLEWGMRRFFNDTMSRVHTATRLLIASRWRSPLLTLVVACTMIPAYILHDGDATTLPMQLTLFGFFVFGWLLYLQRDLLPRFRHSAWRPIAGAIVVLPAAVWSTRERLFAPEQMQLFTGVVAGISNSVLAAFMTIGLLGIFQARFDHRPSPLGQYISDASYWIYLIHLPILIAVAGALSATALPAVIKYLLTLAVVVPIVLATYHFCVRSTRFGWMLKGRKRR